MQPDELKALIKDTVGDVVRAEIAVEGDKLIKSLESKYGSVQKARAAGEETNIFDRSGMTPATAGAKKAATAGRFIRGLAAAKGNIESAMKSAKERANGGSLLDREMVGVYEKGLDESKRKAMALSDFTAGGAVVPEEYSTEVIGLLYAQLAVMALGADSIPMANGNITIPYLDSGVTASYVGETATIAPSQIATGQLQLTAKKLAAVVPISNDLLKSPSARADAYVQNDLINRLRVRADQAFLLDDGANGKPKGIVNWAPAANTFASSGLTLANKVSDLGKMIRQIQLSNVPFVNPGFVLEPRSEWGLKLQLDGLGNFVFMRMMESGNLMGFPYKSTTTIPNNGGGGGDEAKVIFACFGHVIIGDTENLEITVHPDGSYHDGTQFVSGVSTDSTPIRAIARHDLGCRYRGKEVAVLTAVKWA